MEQINLKLPDNSIIQVNKGTTVEEAAHQIGPRLAKNAVCGRFNNILVDLKHSIITDGSFSVITRADSEGLDIQITQTESEGSNGNVPALIANIPIKEVKHNS